MRGAICLASFVSGCAHAGVPATPATIEAASHAAFNSDYATARALYAAAGRTALDAKEREDAEIALATIEWRIDANAGAARVRLEALATVRAFLEESRMERDSGRSFESQALARKALALAQKKDERKSAELELASAIVESHLRGRLSSAAQPASDLQGAFGILRRMVDEERGRLRPSLLYLDAALMLGEGDAAFDAWTSYFAGAAQSALLSPAAAILGRLLPQWRGGDSAEIADALAASRLFDEAILAGGGPPVVAWDGYLHRVEELTNAYYRDVANGRGQPRAYRRELMTLTLGICRALAVACSDETIEGQPDTPLYARFGALIGAGETGGIFNLHFGHAVADQKRQVTQYGHGGTVRFILLDSMASNGFESWSWDGRAQHGGWADAGRIVQVRTAYAEGAIYEWERLTDDEQRKKWDEEIALETGKDWNRAAADPHCYLPGLSMRMRRDAGLRVLDELRARGLRGDALRESFIGEMGQRVTESSIFAHEGRHAIDAELRPRWWTWLVESASQPEFQAKLSEIAFAPDPKLAMTGGIIAGNIGSESPHGVANRRIMRGIVEWMRAHEAKIAGLAPTRPLLPQLDRLTADQLRAAARGMDPMAK